MRILLFILILVEIIGFVLFVDEFGFLALFLEIIFSAIIGVMLLFSVGNLNKESYFNIINRKISLSNFIGAQFLKMLAGILLIIPGLLSDCVGLICMIIAFLLNNKKQDSSAQHWKNDDIIDAEIIEEKEKINKN